MHAIQHGRKNYPYDMISRYARLLGFGDIHTKIEPESNLHAIIAVHNTTLGPAIGGCRFLHYEASGQAIIDSLRLAYMMTLKSAISGLAHGGAKSVIIAPRQLDNREQLFEHFGDFIHELNGRYISACDVGTTTNDMDTIATRTPYVIGAAKTHKHQSNPATHTAKGVFLGMRAALAHRLNTDNFDGIRVAIQGAGSVAFALTKQLTDAGAKIIACDTNHETLGNLKDQFNVETVEAQEIYDVDCDIFSPCALGGTINFSSIQQIKASIIAGSANNQLSHPSIATLLAEKNVLYAPDFVINSGGLINAAIVYDYQNPALADTKIDQLYSTLLNLFEMASKEKVNTQEVARRIAVSKLKKAQNDMNQPIIKTRQQQTLLED